MDTVNSKNHRSLTSADLFADSFDEWIEPPKTAPTSSPVSRSVELPVGTSSLQLGESEPVTVVMTPAAKPERWRRTVGWTALSLGALLLITPLLPSAFSSHWRQSQVVSTSSSLPLISHQTRAAWRKVIGQNAFELAREQAKEQRRNKRTNEQVALAQKAVLQTINSGGPDYQSFAQAKAAGVVDGTLWNLALTHAARGGILPVSKTMRQARADTPRITKPRRMRVARRFRRPTPKQAVILGRGPVREDSASIILIRD